MTQTLQLAIEIRGRDVLFHPALQAGSCFSRLHSRWTVEQPEAVIVEKKEKKDVIMYELRTQ